MPMPVASTQCSGLDAGDADRSYPIVTGDYSAPRWESTPVVVGTPIVKPAPVFTKLDESVIATELGGPEPREPTPCRASPSRRSRSPFAVFDNHTHLDISRDGEPLDVPAALAAAAAVGVTRVMQIGCDLRGRRPHRRPRRSAPGGARRRGPPPQRGTSAG
jgi:hypothetical protein